jgi:hypothetical protein
MNATSAKCGHVKRRLLRNEPLTGKVLEFAISVIAESAMAGGDDLLRRVAYKLRAGEQLDDYELHIMIDVLLPHKRSRALRVQNRGPRKSK